ncbi:MAG: hypothetical protein JNN15_04790 [Blastocatellia bacterium]|nr:hypothetical protein [Blastocatellia bacterium]
MVTTHSPFFVDALKAEELRVIERNKDGYTEATCASDIPGIKEFMDAGATLGQLWMEGYFNNRQRS